MIRQSYTIDIITPCFCSGAEPEKAAEIRAPSIRGQLRWWFRVLGGFKSLAQMSLREQEALVFGSTAGDDGNAGKLAVRVLAQDLKLAVKDGQELGHRNFSDAAYLTFPIQSREKGGQKTEHKARGVILSGTFTMDFLFRGSIALAADLRALAVIFSELGSLGFRGRRAMGALALSTLSISLQDALKAFQTPDHVSIKCLAPCAETKVIPTLGRWLKQWRAHGQSGKNDAEKIYPGYDWAKSDHDQGAAALQRKSTNAPTYRSALGLPIIQFFSNGGGTVNWEANKGGGGRFASPVILRPHRDTSGNWQPLVIFVDSMKWPSGKSVFLDGQPRQVSRDLYEAMKKDASLQPYL